MRRVLFALLLFLNCQPSIVRAQEALTQYDGKIVESVTIDADGPLKKISPEDLMKLIKFKEGEAFSLSRSQNTVKQLYSTDLFFDVQVEVEAVADDRVQVKLVLVRKYLVEQIQFGGEVELDDQELRSELALREGEAYFGVLMEETLSRLLALYQNHGYYRAQIQPKFEIEKERAAIKIEFEVEAGDQARVASLTIDAEGDIPQSEILAQMELRPGEEYSEVQMNQDLQNLETFYALRGYLRPDIYVQGGARYDSPTNSVDLTVRIVPRERTEIEFQGIELSQEQMAELPLYSQRGPSRAFLKETAEQLEENLQEEGFFLAKVEVNQPTSESEIGRIEFKVDKGQQFKVAGVEFRGNQFATEESLEGLVRVEEAGLFSRGKFTTSLLQNDLDRIRLFYQQRGFLDIQVEPELVEGNPELTIVYQIQEGPRSFVDQILIAGNEEVEIERLMEEIQLKQGDPFSTLALAQDRANIIGVYENLGYRNVGFNSEVSYPGPGRVEISYLIEEGDRYFVENEVVVGNVETKRSVIDRETMIEPGDPLSIDQILQSETNLYNLAIFNRVEVRPVPSYGNPGYRSVIVQVDEGKKYTLVYGIGYKSEGTVPGGARGTFGITNSNFLGMARSLSLAVRAGIQRQRANLSYTVPRPFGFKLPTVLSLTVDNEERVNDREEILRFGGKPFDSRRFVASSQSEKVLSRRESLFFRYNYEQVKLNVPEDLAAPLQFFRAEENLDLSSLSLSYLNESRNDPTNPTDGFFLNGETQLSAAAIGSQEQFFRIQASGQYYQRFYRDVVLATSLRIGVITPFGETAEADVDNPVPISERFFAGGGTSLRGLPQDLAGPLLKDPDTGEPILVDKGNVDDPDLTPVPLGGNALVVGNVEVRFPIIGLVGGVLFYDVGNVFESVSRLGGGSFSNAVGFGLSLDTPVGPVRLDLAYNPSPPEVEGFKFWTFHINLGHPF